jgi:hypothetical protein
MRPAVKRAAIFKYRFRFITFWYAAIFSAFSSLYLVAAYQIGRIAEPRFIPVAVIADLFACPLFVVVSVLVWFVVAGNDRVWLMKQMNWIEARSQKWRHARPIVGHLTGILIVWCFDPSVACSQLLHICCWGAAQLVWVTFCRHVFGKGFEFMLSSVPIGKGVRRGECAICFVKFKAHHELRLLKCKHKFHTKCVDSYLAEHRKCPECTQTID